MSGLCVPGVGGCLPVPHKLMGPDHVRVFRLSVSVFRFPIISTLECARTHAGYLQSALLAA